MQFQLDVRRQLSDDFLYGRFRNRNGGGCRTDAVFPVLGCHQRSGNRRTDGQDAYKMGQIPPMAADCSAAYGTRADADILGASGLAVYGKDRLYGCYILHSGVRLHLCKYSLWNAVRGDDAEYRRTGENQYVSLGQRNDCNRRDQYYYGSFYCGAWPGE